jgi:hypothetical protein
MKTIQNAPTTAPQAKVQASDNPEVARMMAEIARLKAENEALSKAKAPSQPIKLTDKGGVSVYGVGRFPVTLYRSQWLKLIAKLDEIKAFLEANKARLDEVEAKHGEAKAAAKAAATTGAPQ